MQNSSTGGRKKIFIGIGVILVVGAVWFLYQSYSSGALQSPSKAISKISEPALHEGLAQSARITATEGGIVRAVDENGIVTVLKVPAGALAVDTEITLTPLKPSTTGLRSGVKVEPENIAFTKPVTLSFNWRLAESKAYKTRPYVLSYHSDTGEIGLAATQRALVVKNYMPGLITTGGWYGVSDDATLGTAAAKETLSQGDDRLTTLDAGLTNLTDLTAKETKLLKEEVALVLNQEEPELNELYLAIKLEESLSDSVSLISKAHAYELFDGYLQFRCNLPQTTYEDAMIAMQAAAAGGYTAVEETCRIRAEKLLLERARLVDREADRPLIDAVEVLQQMQALGLDDTGSAGAEIASRLSDDIIASLTLDDSTGRVREDTASTDPLLRHNSTVIMEMLGVGVTSMVGIESFDEAGLKKFGDTMGGNMDKMVQFGDGLCDLLDDPLFASARSQPEVVENCEKIKSGRVQKGVDQWRIEVDEYAEGIDAIQRGGEAEEGWDDFSEADRYLE